MISDQQNQNINGASSFGTIFPGHIDVCRVKRTLHFGLDQILLAPLSPMLGLSIRLLPCLSDSLIAPAYIVFY